jgi:hypothetical protein
VGDESKGDDATEGENLPGETARMSRAYLDELLAKKLAEKAEDEARASEEGEAEDEEG